MKYETLLCDVTLLPLFHEMHSKRYSLESARGCARIPAERQSLRTHTYSYVNSDLATFDSFNQSQSSTVNRQFPICITVVDESYAGNNAANVKQTETCSLRQILHALQHLLH